MKYLNLTGVEAMVARAILDKALALEAERDKFYWRNMAAVVQSGVARAFGAK